MLQVGGRKRRSELDARHELSMLVQITRPKYGFGRVALLCQRQRNAGPLVGLRHGLTIR